MYYGMGELIKHAVFVLYTKVRWPRARLVRLPIYARTKKNILYGDNFTTGYSCKIAAVSNSKIIIGANVTLGDYVQIQGSNEIIIGDNVLCASRVYIGDSNHGFYSGDNQSDPSIPPNSRPLKSGRVKIGNNVWIGNGVTIVGDDISIGDGTIIGANCVVLHNLDAQSIYAGNPAVKIKQWDSKTMKWEKVNKEGQNV